MPIDRSKYPADWDDLSKAIRARAGDKCEFCGVPNHVFILRSTANPEQYVILTEGADYIAPNGAVYNLMYLPDDFDDSKEVWIVLTVAHLDQDTTNNAPANLKALCQRCHLNLDRPHNLVKGRATRIDKKHKAIRKAGQLSLLE
jgi:hypothetical protein